MYVYIRFYKEVCAYAVFFSSILELEGTSQEIIGIQIFSLSIQFSQFKNN